MPKLAVIIHGWPRSVTKDSFLFQYFLKNGYKVLNPYLFDSELVFNAKNLVDKIQKHLNNRRPDVIVGISLGGLILPSVAQEFPQVRLVFIATGPYLKLNSSAAKLLMCLCRNKLGFRILKLARFLPKKFLAGLYERVSPFTGSKKQRKEYDTDVLANLDWIFAASEKKEREILKFVHDTNNAPLLKELRNQALIFSGALDPIMPLEMGKKLNKLLKNSRLVETEGSHFNVFNKKCLSYLEKFLSSWG